MEVQADTQDVNGVVWAHVIAIRNNQRYEGWVLQSVLETATPDSKLESVLYTNIGTGGYWHADNSIYTIKSFLPPPVLRTPLPKSIGFGEGWVGSGEHMPIHFGTDGWRAVISDSFTFDNLRIVAQAIADAVASEGWDQRSGPAEKSGNPEKARGFPENAQGFGGPKPDPKKIVVGFDTRFLSDRFAGEVARVLAANGFTVLLSQADAPTPAISFAVKHQSAIAGVMITASHNAPRYNEVKLKASYGGSALPEQCRRVEIYINDNEERARGPNLMDFQKARDAGLIQKFNPLPAYFERLNTLISTNIIADNCQRFVVNSMYGAGRGVIKAFLQGTGCDIAEIRSEINPGFGGIIPNRSRRISARFHRRSVPGWVTSVSSPTATRTASVRWTSAARSLIRIRFLRCR